MLVICDCSYFITAWLNRNQKRPLINCMCLSPLDNSGLSIALYLQDPEEFKCGQISSLEVKEEFV